MQGYNRARFARDVGAGLTVGVVALPLAMAFAIASGLTPQAGLWTAILAGLAISLLGGSSVQIGGLGLACLGGLFLWPRLWHARVQARLPVDIPGLKEASEVGARVPGPVVALVTLTLLSWYFRFPVETIASRFGAIPQALPSFVLP